jgi:hypothetical protein
VLALLLFTPAIPELLTGSTPITGLVYDPVGFLIDYAFLLGLYGAGALLVREFAVVFHKGWASILLLGAAYGILEEGFAVHTFFRTSGAPVGALATFGHAFGVNWLWAFGITAFHATYSIALPILLVGLWYPEARSARWFDRGSIVLLEIICVGTVAFFSLHEPFPPSPAAFAFFLAVVIGLVYLAGRLPVDLLSVRAREGRASPLALVLVGTLGFDGWILLLVLASSGHLPAVFVAVMVAGVNLAALSYITHWVGSFDLERSEFYFATGMLLVLWVWDVPIEFTVPGILAVAAVFAYLQYRLARRVFTRSPEKPNLIPTGASGSVPPPLS